MNSVLKFWIFKCMDSIFKAFLKNFIFQPWVDKVRPKLELAQDPQIYRPRFSNPDRLLNRKREKFKIFEVEPRSNYDDVIIN